MNVYRKASVAVGIRTLALLGLIAVSLLVCLAASRSAAGVTLSDPAQGEETGRLVIAGSFDYPPYSFLEDGEPVGFAVALSQAVAEVLGFEVEIELDAWSRVRQRLDEGSVALVHDIAYSEERSQRYVFSPPFHISPYAVIAHRHAPSLEAFADLSTSRVVAVRGDMGHDYLVSRGMADDVAYVDEYAEAIALVEAGAYDFTMMDQLVALYWFDRLGTDNVSVTSISPFQLRYSFAARTGRDDLVLAFAGGLAVLRELGELDALYQKWLGVPAPWVEAEGAGLSRSVLFIVGGFLLVIWLLVVWAWILRRTVAYQTAELQQINDRRRLTLQSIGDAVISTDLSGFIVEINPVAEALTGWSQAEAVGKPLADVFCIVSGTTRMACEDPVRRVLRGGAPVSIATDTVLIARDGTERQIADSAAPIMDDDQKIRGVILVFRDVTEDRQSQEAVRMSEERFRLLFENSMSAIVLHEVIEDEFGEAVDFRYRAVNQAFESLTGKHRSELIGRTLRDVHPGLQLFWLRRFVQVVQTGEPTEFQEYSPAMGKHVENRVYKPAPGQLVVMSHDITERELAVRGLRASEAENRSIVELIPDLIVQADAEGTILAIRSSSQFPLAFDENAFIGRPVRDVFPADRAARIRCAVQRTLRTHVLETLEVDLELESGAKVWLECLMLPLYEEQVMVLIRDVSERKQAEQELRHLTFHDLLTGLFNRRYLEEELRRLDTERQLPLSIIMTDVNGLKVVNDSLGHHSGDRLLQHVAAVIRRACRQEDIIARWGGDEFVILLPRTSTEETGRICERLDALSETADEDPIKLSMSWGLATKDSAEQDVFDVLTAAENAMYRHKSMNTKSSRSAILASLQRTLKEKSQENEAHTDRMRVLARQFGEYLGLGGSEINDLELAALLHDVGKVALPPDILNKPEPLTDEEWEQMKKHPEVGYRIAMSSPDLVGAAEGILMHHERWDGHGYPKGVEGEGIPRMARIVAVIDAYEAMTSEWYHSGSRTWEEALDEIAAGSGTQFDPVIAEAFVAMVREFGGQSWASQS